MELKKILLAGTVLSAVALGGCGDNAEEGAEDQGLLDQAVEAVSDATEAVVDTAGDVAGAVVDTTKSAVETVVDTAGDVTGAVVDTTQEAARHAAELAQRAAQTAADAAQNVQGAVTGE